MPKCIYACACPGSEHLQAQFMRRRQDGVELDLSCPKCGGRKILALSDPSWAICCSCCEMFNPAKLHRQAVAMHRPE